MVIKNQLGVMKDNRGEKGKLMDVDGGAELDFFFLLIHSFFV